MKIIPAFLIQEYTDDEKMKLRLVGATYSISHQGWFLSSEQKNKFDQSLLDPTILPKSMDNYKGIFIDDLIDSWKVSGDTYQKREIIKGMGGKWNVSDKSWRIPRENASRSQIEHSLQ